MWCLQGALKKKWAKIPNQISTPPPPPHYL
jgi:hypothetical protein